ncbi:hypothetical protein [Thermofilum sp.]|uniref:hypothetical protein n=1 Tax=Thermofilum sp. TaxID=1961369 RepID=UPI00316AA12B
MTNTTNTTELYTPGHNVFTDTLIMHGMIRVLSWIGANEGEVERIGERYRISVKNGDNVNKLLYGTLGDLKVKSAEDLKVMLNIYSSMEKEDLSSTVKKFHNVRNFNLSATRNWPADLNRGLEGLNLTPYKIVNHIDHYNERRKQRKKKELTAYLPLGPIYGKYVGESYKIIDASYSICLNCFTLSTLGLIYGTGIAFLEIRQQRKTKLNYYYVTIAPTKATFDEIILFQRSVEELNIDLREEGRRKSNAIQGVTALATMLYLFSYGETVVLFDNPVDILMWGIETERQGPIRIIELTRVTGKKLLEAIARIKYRIPEYPRIAKVVIAKDPMLLHAIAESVIFGTDPYNVVREYRRLTDEISKEGEKEVAKLMKEYSADLAKVLLNLSIS